VGVSTSAPRPSSLVHRARYNFSISCSSNNVRTQRRERQGHEQTGVITNVGELGGGCCKQVKFGQLVG
jgi:hypothetical protein